jgi:hypothetical protein
MLLYAYTMIALWVGLVGFDRLMGRYCVVVE